MPSWDRDAPRREDSEMITTLTSLKARLKIDEFDLTEDTLLTNLILHLGDRFDAVCNRKFERSAAATFEFEADKLAIVPLRYPIESIDRFDVMANFGDGWEEQTDVEYLIRRAGEIACMVCFPSALGSSDEVARITYAGGYVMPGGTVGSGQTALPSGIEQAAIEQLVNWYQNKDRLGLANVSGQGGSVAANPISVVAPLDLLPQVHNLLRSYVRWNP